MCGATCLKLYLSLEKRNNLTQITLQCWFFESLKHHCHWKKTTKTLKGRQMVNWQNTKLSTSKHVFRPWKRLQSVPNWPAVQFPLINRTKRLKKFEKDLINLARECDTCAWVHNLVWSTPLVAQHAIQLDQSNVNVSNLWQYRVRRVNYFHSIYVFIIILH